MNSSQSLRNRTRDENTRTLPSSCRHRQTVPPAVARQISRPFGGNAVANVSGVRRGVVSEIGAGTGSNTVTAFRPRRPRLRKPRDSSCSEISSDPDVFEIIRESDRRRPRRLSRRTLVRRESRASFFVARPRENPLRAPFSTALAQPCTNVRRSFTRSTRIAAG